MSDDPKHRIPDYTAFSERPIYEALADVARVLGNPVRLRLLDVLQQGERAVEELSVMAGVPLKNTSAQLQRLREAQMVTSVREGTRVTYRIVPDAGRLLAHFEHFAENNVSRVRDEILGYFSEFPLLNPISVQELVRQLEQGDMVVVDVRPRSEYEEGHVAGAISIPLPELAERLEEIRADARVVAYCEGPYCLASPSAARFLADSGYDVQTLKGGFTAWERREDS